MTNNEKIIEDESPGERNGRKTGIKLRKTDGDAIFKGNKQDRFTMVKTCRQKFFCGIDIAWTAIKLAITIK